MIYFGVMAVLLILLAFGNSAYGETRLDLDIPEKENPKRLNELFNITEEVDYDKEREGTRKIRLSTLKNAAFSWGVQEGLFWRHNIIMKFLDEQSLNLHTVFDFNKFIVDGKMLMPSVVESERIFDQTSRTSARTVNVSFTLDKSAKIVPKPPTWRDYLLRTIDKPERPHAVIFPRTSDETDAWIELLEKGWKSGIKQANDIFEIDLRNLQKNFEGRYRFRKLLAMGYVTMPQVKSSKYSVLKLEDGRTININDVLYSITSISEFTDSDKWVPYFREGAINRE